MSGQTDLKLCQEKIGYHFRKIKYLTIALTHSSYANEGKKEDPCNERQEFLGDAVLSIIVSDYLFRHYSHLPEGELTKLRAALVCEKALCRYALSLGLGDFLLLGKGEEATGGRQRPSILADAFEAILAAIYLDGGYEKAEQFVLQFVVPQLAHEGEEIRDYKTQLQEVIQQNREERIRYVLISESGPDHDKKFCVEVHMNSNVIGRGQGHSKKEAEQMAAKEALELMGE